MSVTPLIGLIFGITCCVLGVKKILTNLKMMNDRTRIRVNDWYVIDIPKDQPDSLIVRNDVKKFFYTIEGRSDLHAIQEEAYKILSNMIQNDNRLKGIRTIKAGSFVIDYHRFGIGEVKEVPLSQLGREEKRDLSINQCLLAARNTYNWKKTTCCNITKSFKAAKKYEWQVSTQDFMMKFSS